MRQEQVTGLLQQLRAELNRVIGKQMEGLYLMDPQARGQARPNSDLDVLVVIRGDYQYFDMVERTGELAARLSLLYDTVISLAFTSGEKYNNQKIPFLLNVRQAGIAI